MKTNEKKLKLISHGLSSPLVNSLNENQINALYERLSEAKKETKEQVTQLPPKPSYKIGDKGGALPPSEKGYAIKKNTDSSVTATPMEEEIDNTETEDIALAVSEKDPQLGLAMSEDLKEKFESKKQQKYFFAKCGDGKTKEQKKWCKMADEFSKSTSKKQYEKMPEKKETKEGYLDMVGKGMNKSMQNKIADIRPGLKFESKLEKKITSMVDRHIYPTMTKRDFLKLIENYNISEQGETEAPVKPEIKPDVKPERPTPSTPYQPKYKPAPKAKEKEIETPVKPDVKPERQTPKTPYQPKHKPAPKAKDELPNWLTFKSIGIKLKGQ
jgi:hypothetical protein